MILNKTEILSLDRFYRANLINSIVGIKQASLIGTVSNKNISNLALFSSVVHLGSNPQLVAMFSRPNTGTPKQTLKNIIDSNAYTINHVNSKILHRSHATSKKFGPTESEFAQCNLEEYYIDGFQAPFVKECNISIGVSYRRHFTIDENDVVMIIGEIDKIIVDEQFISETGEVLLSNLDSVGVAGNNSYYSLQPLSSLDYVSSDNNEMVSKLLELDKS